MQAGLQRVQNVVGKKGIFSKGLDEASDQHEKEYEICEMKVNSSLASLEDDVMINTARIVTLELTPPEE